jgi:hypothetical protein
MAFQMKFPFHTMHIEEFLQILFSLNKEKIMIQELSKSFNDEVWESLDVINLILGLPHTEDNGEIDIYSMICLGILWCGGDLADKAQAFYQVVKNPSSGDRLCYEQEEW